MSELGDDASRYHAEIGKYARDRADVLIGVGAPSRDYAADHWFDTSEACAAAIERMVQTDDVVLIKGSASARMPMIVDRLRGAFATRAPETPRHPRACAAATPRADFIAPAAVRETSRKLRARP